MNYSTLINVLDHGFVRFVNANISSYTHPDGEPPRLSGDLDVVRAARVSYDADWRAGDDAGKDEKLIAYLLKNKHTSPFESVVFTFEVKAPIFIFRQWHRHRTWSYNEVSARYTELPEDYYVPEPETIGKQSKSNKQMREFEEETGLHAAMTTRIWGMCDDAFRAYRMLLDDGCPRELARTVLPLATYSRMFATVDLHNLLHFLQLRLHPHAQWEIQQYALAIVQLIEPLVPVTIKHWKEMNDVL